MFANNSVAHGVFFVKYASVLLQAITIQIDEAFLYAFLDLTDVSASWNTTSERYVRPALDTTCDT